GESAEIIADVGDVEEVDPERRKLLGQKLRVGVEDLPEQQLGANCDDLCFHATLHLILTRPGADPARPPGQPRRRPSEPCRRAGCRTRSPFSSLATLPG